MAWKFSLLILGAVNVQSVSSLDSNLAKHRDGPFGSTIHAIPRLTPTEHYDDHMEDIHAAALRKAYGKEAPSMKVLHSKPKGGTARTRGDRAGFVFGFGFVCVVIFVCLFYSMMKSKGVLRGQAYQTLDTMIGVFLAGLWVNTFDSMLEFHGISPQWKVIVSAIHALLVLTLVLFLSFRIRRNDKATVIFMTIGGHYVVFSSIQFSTEAHAHYFDDSTMWGLIGISAIFFIYGIIVAATMQVRKNFPRDEAWEAKAESTEDNFAAIGLAIIWGVVVRAAIAGEYHEFNGHSGNDKHTAGERWMLLMYSVVMMPIVVFATGKIGALIDKGHLGYVARRGLRIVSVFLGMTVMFGFILWGEWEFHEYLFPDSHITGGLVFAIGSTLFGAAGVVALSRIECLPGSEAEKNREFGLGCISYFIGMGWSSCVSTAMEDLASSYTHHGIVKLWLCVLMFAIVIPPYVSYFRDDLAIATEKPKQSV